MNSTIASIELEWYSTWYSQVLFDKLTIQQRLLLSDYPPFVVRNSSGLSPVWCSLPLKSHSLCKLSVFNQNFLIKTFCI